MKIVVLDGYAANPGDLSWESFKDFGELTVYDRTAQSDVLKRASDADIIMTNKVIIDAVKNTKLIVFFTVACLCARLFFILH